MSDLSDQIGPALASALEKKGYTELTPVQVAVLAPELAGRDLRITSQTGSGKTVAIGLSVASRVEEHAPGDDRVSRPAAIVVAPTRELAKQVEQELSWLFAPLHARVASVTGGAAYRDELRALSRDPAVVVGTPGRLLDHLERGAVDATDVGCMVLDEADRLLDLGFREELEAILSRAKGPHRTHLVSATFPRDVRALADRFQSDPAHVEGTPLGAANQDIEHVIHVVDPRQRLDAIINLLLAHPGQQTLVFARTRAEVARLTSELSSTGFSVASLSGEMEQRERNRALTAFRNGHQRALIATDVAARGIDIADIGRVIHAEPPEDSDSYTHRSGRTGRAGRKGTSSILVSPGRLSRTLALLGRLGLRYRFEPIPSAEEIRRRSDARVLEELTSETADEASPDGRTEALARRIVERGNPERAISRLLEQVGYQGPTEAREIDVVDFKLDRPQRAPRTIAPPRGRRDEKQREWRPFHVSWGEAQGADPRRLLALLCRRGDIRGTDVGAIRVSRNFAVVEIAEDVATRFWGNARKPDPREPRILIRQERGAVRTAREAQKPERPGKHPKKKSAAQPAPKRGRAGAR
jgi:ATP-dependent RNA helicase DeaD